MGAWVAVAIGGALGSVARHGVNHLMNTLPLMTRFPVGTAVVNVVGCFVIGLLAGLLASDKIALPFYWRELVFVGVIGGFTTFSTFGLDTFTLARMHSTGIAVANVTIQLLGGLSAVYAGYRSGA